MTNFQKKKNIKSHMQEGEYMRDVYNNTTNFVSLLSFGTTLLFDFYWNWSFDWIEFNL